jgi:cytoskeletal protein RodZ
MLQALVSWKKIALVVAALALLGGAYWMGARQNSYKKQKTTETQKQTQTNQKQSSETIKAVDKNQQQNINQIKHEDRTVKSNKVRNTITKRVITERDVTSGNVIRTTDETITEGESATSDTTAKIDETQQETTNTIEKNTTNEKSTTDTQQNTTEQTKTTEIEEKGTAAEPPRLAIGATYRAKPIISYDVLKYGKYSVSGIASYDDGIAAGVSVNRDIVGNRLLVGAYAQRNFKQNKTQFGCFVGVRF